MLLSDGTGLSRFGKALAGLAIIGALAGCQVRPLYSTGSGTESKLASVSISEATDRVEQKVRNDLIFLFAGGAGEPQNAIYHLEMNVTVRNIGVLIDVADDIPRAGRIVVAADYNLVKTDSGETLASGKRSSVALVDFPVQEFAKLRAVRNAENRAARELAELIRADVAAALGRR
ncbi:LPS assembly lipoprotein LptE [Shinella sp.]|uniref:LPS assembly lipoprotein LptE n=1 Tax=Shinella sp. TaxID=1870904 RepID=UPI0029B1D440|nr:LPS assembly lipoprotein LptE [Shinella sp.]MDX3977773.1 LPS assembly lipoprotein LptE [Shinella sp.]